MTSVSHWVAGARPRTLPAAVAPVLVGTALAGAGWLPVRAPALGRYDSSARDWLQLAGYVVLPSSRSPSPPLPECGWLR